MVLGRFLDKVLKNEKSEGIILILCTVISLLFANSIFSEPYLGFWHIHVAGLSIEEWINDGLMTIFFLMIGLELEKEIYIGEFSKPKNAILPVAAAIGGMMVPAVLYLLFNYGLPTQSGIGIPMATDIAFALGILSLLGKRVSFSLKIFLMALAVVDDLGAIVIIALFYTKDFVLSNLGIALGIYAGLIVLNKIKINSLLIYFIGGAAMWYFMLQSGVHATITGVLLAFAIPFNVKDAQRSPSTYLRHKLHIPVSFFILPLFALANTAVSISGTIGDLVSSLVSLGIFSGLFIGKPIGIFLATLLVVEARIASLPQDIHFKEILGVGILGGIGFTMSIFITLLAFEDNVVISTAKIAILISSLFSGVFGFLFLKIVLGNSNDVTLNKI